MDTVEMFLHDGLDATQSVVQGCADVDCRGAHLVPVAVKLTLGCFIKEVVIWLINHVCKTLGFTEGIAHIIRHFSEPVQSV